MVPYDTKALYTSLSELAVIPKNLLDSALEESTRNKKPFDEVLLARDLISDGNLGRLIADIINVPFVTLSQIAIPDDILRLIPEVVARQNYVIAYEKEKTGLHIATCNKDSDEFKNQIQKATGWPVLVSYATKKDIEDAFALYLSDAVKAFTEILQTNADEIKAGKTVEPPIIKIVDTILSYAYENKVSDIHIEPYEHTSLVRFRIDGILHDIVRLPELLHDQIMTRIKVMSKLRTDEHQAAQDGKLQFLVHDEELDIRVSIVPIEEGEKAVLRLLSERSRQLTLMDLGFSEDDFAKLERASKKPYGMLLATGPTGSGKTTTLYAILKVLNRRTINIMTIEDPVEYDIEGVNQIQVNPKTNLTFAAGLRSIVRQDPDIILVGEIRDGETAGIAVNSAMTGHLVLSTIHANDAGTAFPRLLDFEIEPFLVSSTVNIIVAQRLVRKICMKCRMSVDQPLDTFKRELPPKIFDEFFTGKTQIKTYQGKGCPVCHGTGYEGRIGIFEVLEVDDDIRKAVTSKKDAQEIMSIAISHGMHTMMEDGIHKVLEGLTTIEEVLRVTK